ncbi:MAG: AAA family ATPase [Propionibacteriaceae bacterium]|jgi:predicted AAA+ superfamily ATPase|nr:AAA family ATPase [Propionibacteriaceae bacterium]
MDRSILADLQAWKTKAHRKPLIIDGARQVGKTWVMKHFAEASFKDFLYINFDHLAYLDYHKIFTSGHGVGKIIELLEFESGMRITPGQTLLVFDEIQEVPAALSGLKYFNEEMPDQHIICAGSQMGIALHQGTSFPVGNVDTINMLPMSFNEFLHATGSGKYAELIEDGNLDMVVQLHEKYLELLKTYIYVGGMPEAVQRYSDGEDLEAIRELQYQLLNNFRADFSKHAPAALISKLNLVWDSIPRQLAKENKKYVWSVIRKGARASEFENAIQWLEDCGLVHRVSQLSVPELPLAAYAAPDTFKVYSLDIGLLAAQAGVSAKMIFDGSGVYTQFKGTLAEQFALQEMKHHHKRLFYWTGTSSEIAFVIQSDNHAIPIEVKSGENLNAKSLRAYQDKYHPIRAYKLSMLPYRENEIVINLPLYLASLIHGQTLEPSP